VKTLLARMGVNPHLGNTAGHERRLAYRPAENPTNAISYITTIQTLRYGQIADFPARLGPVAERSNQLSTTSPIGAVQRQ
jgi:hypothetical protein